MRLVVSLAVSLCLATGAAQARTQVWQQGWDNFGEQLDYSTSSVVWHLTTATRDLKFTYTLAGARANALYQVGIHLFCTTAPAMLGRFGFIGGAVACGSITRQGVTKTVAAGEFGVILTDVNGNGTLAIDLGPVAAGTYSFEFSVRDGAGCNVVGGGSVCSVDFQSPGPFGTATKIVVP